MLRSIAWYALLGCSLYGCHGEQPLGETAHPETVPENSEPPWTIQIEQIRNGESTTVRFSKPINKDHFWMLSEGCETLTILELRHESAARQDWSVLKHLPSVSRLVLHGPVDDADLHEISQASSLEILNLPQAVFTNEGLKSLERLPLLTLLRFGSPHVTDAGMEHLAAMSNLRFVHLIDVPITDKGLEPFRRMPMLESFYIDGGRCSEEGLSRLLKAQPNLHIHVDQLHLPGHGHSHK